MPEEDTGGGDLVICPTCHKIWPKGTKFCTQCGTWIESGQVLEPGPAPKPGGQPAIGPSPPGITPRQPPVGSSPPGIGPERPVPAPPGGGPALRHTGSAPPSTGVPRPGGPGAGPADVPLAPVARPEDIPQEEPKKKYALRREPQREEHIPTSATFLPKREERKRRKSPVVQTIIVIVCLIAIAFAVISMVFKPLYYCILGTFWDLIGKEDSAIIYFERASGKGSAYADKALAKLGKKVFAKHLKLQYYSDWSAESTISLRRTSGEMVYESTISYTAPGKVSETITRSGSPVADHTIDENGYVQRIGSTVELNAERYAAKMQASIGMSPADLFSEKGKDRVTKALFDDLGMKLTALQGEGESKAYVFDLALEGDAERTGRFSMLVGPFVPWSSAATWSPISRVQYVVRTSDGFLVEVSYYDTNNQLMVQQAFSNFEPKAK